MVRAKHPKMGTVVCNFIFFQFSAIFAQYFGHKLRLSAYSLNN